MRTGHYTTPWREPDEETEDYPGFWVHDGRVSGSITLGPTRLPLWAIIGTLTRHGWAECVRGWGGYSDDAPNAVGGLSEADVSAFLDDLFELRGDFGRLLLVLADAERRERRGGRYPWWQRKMSRHRVATALRRCLAVVEERDAA